MKALFKVLRLIGIIAGVGLWVYLMTYAIGFMLMGLLLWLVSYFISD